MLEKTLSSTVYYLLSVVRYHVYLVYILQIYTLNHHHNINNQNSLARDCSQHGKYCAQTSIASMWFPSPVPNQQYIPYPASPIDPTPPRREKNFKSSQLAALIPKQLARTRCSHPPRAPYQLPPPPPASTSPSPQAGRPSGPRDPDSSCPPPFGAGRRYPGDGGARRVSGEARNSRSASEWY